VVKRPIFPTEDSPPTPVDLRTQSIDRFLAMTEEQRLAHIDRYGIDIVTDDFRMATK
jgi:hypothetical protein